MNTVVIDGIKYNEVPEENITFKNVCPACAFYKTQCYDRDDFTCHADARPDGYGDWRLDVFCACGEVKDPLVIERAYHLYHKKLRAALNEEQDRNLDRFLGVEVHAIIRYLMETG